MKIGCEECMNEFLMLDKGERIPRPVSLHILRCKKCRSEVRALSKAENFSSEPLKIPTPIESDTIEKVMKEIDPGYSQKKYSVPMYLWVIVGIVMIAAMCFYGLVTSSETTKSLEISFYLVFAAIVTGYCATFIGTNLDFFVKRVDNLHLAR